jgi:hypothetical protein
MNDVTFIPTNDSIRALERVYSKFDLGANGLPTLAWENRNLRDYSLNRRLRYFYAPDVYLTKVRVNRQMVEPLNRVLSEIEARWDAKQAEKENLDIYVRSYCFGGGESSGPNAHWWGAAWDLSPLVSGVALEESIKIFLKNGFKWYGASNKALVRHLEYVSE